MRSSSASCVVLGLFDLVLELPKVDFAVGQALLATGQVDQLLADLDLLGDGALLDLDDLVAPVLQLLLDLRSQPDGLFARVDLRLAPERLCLSLRVGEQLLALALGLAEPRRAEPADRDRAHSQSNNEPDRYADDQIHPRSRPEPRSIAWMPQLHRHRARTGEIPNQGRRGQASPASALPCLWD